MYPSPALCPMPIDFALHPWGPPSVLPGFRPRFQCFRNDIQGAVALRLALRMHPGAIQVRLHINIKSRPGYHAVLWLEETP